MEERATDQARDAAADALRRGWVDGAISTDTFEARLGLALGARSEAELVTLTHDLPRRAAAVPETPAVLTVRLRSDEAQIVLGRHRSCDRIFDDDSVSRKHALLRRTRTGLRLHDLDSTNGTSVNGDRIDVADVSAGDTIRLGRVTLRLTD